MTDQEVEAEEAEQPRIKFTFPILTVRTKMSIKAAGALQAELRII